MGFTEHSIDHWRDDSLRQSTSSISSLISKRLLSDKLSPRRHSALNVPSSFLSNHTVSHSFLRRFTMLLLSPLLLPPPLTFAIPLYHRAALSATAHFAAAMLHDLFTNTVHVSRQKERTTKDGFKGTDSYSYPQVLRLTAGWRWTNGFPRRNVTAAHFFVSSRNLKHVGMLEIALINPLDEMIFPNFMSVNMKIWSLHWQPEYMYKKNVLILKICAPESPWLFNRF